MLSLTHNVSCLSAWATMMRSCLIWSVCYLQLWRAWIIRYLGIAGAECVLICGSRLGTCQLQRIHFHLNVNLWHFTKACCAWVCWKSSALPEFLLYRTLCGLPYVFHQSQEKTSQLCFLMCVSPCFRRHVKILKLNAPKSKSRSIFDINISSAMLLSLLFSGGFIFSIFIW